MTKELDPNSIFLGIIIGFICTSLIFWYSTKDTVSYDTNYNIPKDSYQCEPNYMGGCN
jgi:hypothetical protein